MVEGLIPGVRSRRKDRMGIVVALGRSIGGPGACEVFAALGALGPPWERWGSRESSEPCAS